MTWGPRPDPNATPSLELLRAFLWGMACGVVLTVFSVGAGIYVGSCSLYTRPEPYTPPPLVLQGTTPDHEDAGHDR